MRDDSQQNDKSQYLNDGFRDRDGREGFGDDGGTRVGRPEGAQEAKRAPEDAQRGESEPGQPGTNSEPVNNGIEGSINSDEGEGSEQSRVRAATQRPDGSSRAGSGDSQVFDL
jgi:hypothetical protein